MEDVRIETIYALFPKKLSNGKWIWLKHYYRKSKKIYPKIDLPPHISIPDRAFWIILDEYI